MLDQQQLRILILKADREELIQYIDTCLKEMTDQQIDNVFGDLYYEQVVQQMTPLMVLDKIKIFLKDSLAGKYYAPFNMNSKNYTWVPPETEAWYSELSTWLDRSCEIAEQGHRKIGKECLDICFQLIDKQCDDDTVFAHELGDWMICTQQDYKAIYKKLK